MDWQASLRALDKRLADGELSPGEHRRVRDEILAEASGAIGRVRDREVHLPSAAETTQVIARSPSAPVEQPSPMAQPSVVLPPITREHRSTGTIDGNQVFASTGTRHKPWRTAGVAFAVLAVLCASVWWVALRGDEAPATQAQRPAPSVPAAGSPGDRPADALPTLPGTPSANSSTLSIDRAMELKLLSSHDARLYRAHGVEEVVYRGSRSGTTGMMALAVPTRSDADAAAITSALHDHLIQVGFADIAGTRPTSFTRTDAQFTTFGTVYRSRFVCVQVSVSGKPQQDPAQLRSDFEELVKNVTNALPES